MRIRGYRRIFEEFGLPGSIATEGSGLLESVFLLSEVPNNRDGLIIQDRVEIEILLEEVPDAAEGDHVLVGDRRFRLDQILDADRISAKFLAIEL